MECGNEPLLPLEIIIKVLEYLRYDGTTLQSALLVNKTWALEVIKILWEHPPVKQLAAIKDDRRRQFYAYQFRYLRFTSSDSERQERVEQAQFRDLEFPRLKRFAMHRYRPKDGGKMWLGQFLQPSLVDLELAGDAEPAEDVLHLLATRCPQLKSIATFHSFEGLSSGRLIECLDSCKYLRSVCFLGHIENYADSRLLAYLFYRDGLLDLWLGILIEYEMLRNIFKESSKPPLRNVESFDICIESKALPLLVAEIKKPTAINILRVSIEGRMANPLPHFRSLVNLHELHVEVMEDEVWTVSDFFALKSLKKLRSLTINSVFGFIASPTLRDEEFISVFEDMSELEELSFDVETSLSTAAITSLGKNCPRLKTCKAFGRYDLYSWQSIASPLELRLLRVHAAWTELGVQ